MLLLLLVEFLVVLLDGEELRLDLYHLLLVQLQQLHVSHLFLVGDCFLGFVQVLTQGLQAVASTGDAFVNVNLDVDLWHFYFGLLVDLLVH